MAADETASATSKMATLLREGIDKQLQFSKQMADELAALDATIADMEAKGADSTVKSGPCWINGLGMR